MSKKEKLIARLLSRPKDFTYDEARTLLCSLGFIERSKGKTSGSRVEYVRGNDTILLHKPHPSGILKPYQVKQIAVTLQILKLI
ncbi:MAG: type II toxin-antitoxin system HicA family toxin [Muribaculaceae bacterium]|nr:type II toxin-antitoxin system HicA family toxin [Muribaculaceae bacterium]